MASIRKIAPGKYQILWREPIRDEFGNATSKVKQSSETIVRAKDREAKTAANERKSEIERALSHGGINPSEAHEKAERPLSHYAAAYFASVRGVIADDTLKKYVDNYRLYVAPTLGQRPVASISVTDVNTIRSTLLTPKSNARSPLSNQTIKHALGILRRILDHAVSDRAIVDNPAARPIKLPSAHRRDFERTNSTNPTNSERTNPTRLTPEQIAGAADWIATKSVRGQGSPVYALAVTFAAFTGLRASELQGLEIRDLTLPTISGTAGAVSVVRQKKVQHGFKPEPLKTQNAERTVPLDAWLADDVRAYLRDTHQNSRDPQAPLFPGRLSRAAGKALGRNVTDAADMFDWTRPIDEQNVYKMYWLPALKALGFPHSRWHDMRHTFAVMSLQGDHYRDVSRWLGHSKISTTLDIYANVISTEDGGKATPLPRPVPQPASNENVVQIDRKRSG